MQPVRYYYLIKLQYLGFRYHGWQKQPGLKTVERMVERTIRFVLKRKNFKILAAGRTDAMVSVNQTYIELFLDEEPLKQEEFFLELNKYLPQDIRALGVYETHKEFNIIQHPQLKEYLYFFNYGEKAHPFSAAFMVNIQQELDIDLMKKAAKLFQGSHDFKAYTFRPTPFTQTKSEVLACEIVKNDVFQANFFPKKSYMLRVVGEGFKRHQIRLMMGTLIEVARGDLSLEQIRQSLLEGNEMRMTYIAPASGLILNKVEFQNEETVFKSS